MKTVIALAIFIPVMIGIHRLGWWGTETYGLAFPAAGFLIFYGIARWIDRRDLRKRRLDAGLDRPQTPGNQ